MGQPAVGDDLSICPHSDVAECCPDPPLVEEPPVRIEQPLVRQMKGPGNVALLIVLVEVVMGMTNYEPLAIVAGRPLAVDQLMDPVRVNQPVITLQARNGPLAVCRPLGDEPVPVAPPEAGPGSNDNASRGPTAKARALLKEHALSADAVPQSGDRLTAREVEAFVAQQQLGTIGPRAGTPSQESAPTVAGTPRLPTPEEHGMLNTVLWHRDTAAATYLEVEYDPQPWEQYAARYAEERKLFLSPLGALLAHRLVKIAAATPKLNATIVDGRIYQYDHVNLGFTVQAGETLYLTVLHKADQLDAAELVNALADTQRRAMAKKLKPQDVEGATISFSSMARWKVSRHVPILPPYTSLIVAHAAPRGSQVAVMGATYDHRLLSGFDVVRVLEELTRDPAAEYDV